MILIRSVAVLIVVPATYFFMYWLPFSLLPLGGHRWIASPISLLVAAAAGWFVWKQLTDANQGALSSMLSGAVIVGGIGFSAGFFGPLIFAPQANQGPLLGIFITGPLGFVAGAIGGLVYWLVVVRRASIQ